MELLPDTLRSEFALRAEWRKEDERERDRNYLDAVKRKKEEVAEEKREEQEDRELLEYVAATSMQIEAFTVKLDRYDTATVQALMDNQKALEQVQERLREIRKEAYVLPDGRRVYKTEDGQHVFDEQGTEVHDLDPHAIDDKKPRWEGFKGLKDQNETLMEERKEILDYQQELDEARDLSHQQGVTAHALKKEEDYLRQHMPGSVRQHMNDNATPDNNRRDEPQPASFRPAGKLDMPALS